jgi:imidazolonepropionase-like amidohydrolase
MTMKTFTRMLTSAAAIGAAFSALPAYAETTYIHAGSVIADASGEASGPASIIVTDGKIVSIEDGFVTAPEGAAMVNLPDQTVLPGLIDLHVHLTGDPGGDFWKEAIEPDEWGMTERLGQGIYTPVVEDKIRAVAETAQMFMGRALRGGVRIAFGTPMRGCSTMGATGRNCA